MTLTEAALEIAEAIGSYEWTVEEPCWVNAIYETYNTTYGPFVLLVISSGVALYREGGAPNMACICNHYRSLGLNVLYDYGVDYSDPRTLIWENPWLQ